MSNSIDVNLRRKEKDKAVKPRKENRAESKKQRAQAEKKLRHNEKTENKKGREQAGKLRIKEREEIKKEKEQAKKLRLKQKAGDKKSRAVEAEKNRKLREKELAENKAKRDNAAAELKEKKAEQAAINKQKRADEKKAKAVEESARLNAEAEAYKAKTPVSEKAAAKFGTTVFEVECTASARLINAVAKNVNIYKTRTVGNKVSFSARSKDADKIIAILNNLCYNYKIIKVKGFAPSAVRLFGRVGIFLGLAAVVLTAVVYPHFITKVEVDGTLNAAAYDILTKNGVYGGNFVWDFDGNSVSDKLLMLDGIAFASVQKRGTRVYVTVKGERAPDIDDGTVLSGPVTAKKRAAVTRVLVHGGTAEVKYGDIVNEGDVLIGEYILVNEEKVPVTARGEVYGKIYHTMNVFFSDTEIIKIVGRTKKIKRVSLFGQPETPASPFKNYTLEINEAKSGFLIPYRAYTYVFTEITSVKKPNKRTDEAMAREALSKVFEKLPADAKYLDSFYKIIRKTGGVCVEATIETEERIDL